MRRPQGGRRRQERSIVHRAGAAHRSTNGTPGGPSLPSEIGAGQWGTLVVVELLRAG